MSIKEILKYQFILSNMYQATLNKQYLTCKYQEYMLLHMNWHSIFLYIDYVFSLRKLVHGDYSDRIYRFEL